MIRKIIIIFVSVMCVISAQGQDYSQEFETDVNLQVLFEAIAIQESGQDSMAVSPTGKYVGYVQIGPDYLRAFNQIVGYEKYKKQDLYSKTVQWEIFNTVCSRHSRNIRSGTSCVRLHTGANYPGWAGYIARVKRNYINLRK